MSKCKLRPFEHAKSMSKQPAGLVYIGVFVSYLSYPLDPFPRGLGIDLEGSSTFLPLILLMHIDRLDLFSHLYRTLFICIAMCPGSCIDATAFCWEVG